LHKKRTYQGTGDRFYPTSLHGKLHQHLPFGWTKPSPPFPCFAALPLPSPEGRQRDEFGKAPLCFAALPSQNNGQGEQNSLTLRMVTSPGGEKCQILLAHTLIKMILKYFCFYFIIKKKKFKNIK
jgi:hypothetical protein